CNAEKIERWISPALGKLCTDEPAAGELLLAISHVLSAKHAQPKHLSRRELRLKLRIEIAPCGFGQVIPIVLLHPVVDPDGPCLPQASFWGHVASLGSCRSRRTQRNCYAERSQSHAFTPSGNESSSRKLHPLRQLLRWIVGSMYRWRKDASKTKNRPEPVIGLSLPLGSNKLTGVVSRANELNDPSSFRRVAGRRLHIGAHFPRGL